METDRDGWQVLCLAVSKNGKWIAAGTFGGVVILWNAATYNKVWEHRLDSKQVRATVWNVTEGKQTQTLPHKKWVIAGRRETESRRPLFLNPVTLEYNNGLFWFNGYLVVVSDDKIKQLDASTGSTTSEWSFPGDGKSYIAIPKRDGFIARSSKSAVTIWDTTHSQHGCIEHPGHITALALSPDDRCIAIGGKCVSHSTCLSNQDSLPFCSLHPTFRELDIQINHSALDAWKHGHLEHSDELLTTAICQSQIPNHDLLAARALVRARLKHWDEALVDAITAIDIRPSIIAYIAKSVAHVGKGERDTAYRTCDIAFEHFHSTHVTLLLVKAIIVSLAGGLHDAISRMDDLIATVPFNSVFYTIQAYMYFLQGNRYMESNNYETAIHAFEDARTRLRHCRNRPPLMVSLMSGWKFDDLRITVLRRLCEALYAVGLQKDASEDHLEMINTFEKDVYASEPITKWVSEFAQQCLCAPKSNGDAVPTATGETNSATLDAILAQLLREWAKVKLAHDSWKDALLSAVNFVVSRVTIYRVICEHLESIGRTTDASECFRQLVFELTQGESSSDDQVEWVLGKLESLGDPAMSIERHDDVIFRCSDALSLSPATPQDLLIQRSKAYVAKGLLQEALNDANKVIELEPSSPWGYERKHAALHKAGDYRNATIALEKMFSRISQSSDPEIRVLHRQYVNPGDTRSTIRRTIQDVIRDSPRVLIDTISGRLCDKSEQAASFESLPIFNQMVSSMTTHIDNVSIKRDVTEFYRYAMFSHRWEGKEPLFEQVICIVVYDLDDFPTHDKLKMFCKIVQDAGLRWAWSDTCCINKVDHLVLQEALVAMFKWSVWNTRAWTFQEYHASKVVRFYTKDWTLYTNLDIPNHKESPEIISEMEEATGVSAQALMALRPGLDDIREKLCLASTRQTTFVEDAAYSLLGIFSMSLPVVYGEGDRALGRLLAQLLTSSGDTSILAWNGNPGSFNNCLPIEITVFNQLPPSHIPPVLASSEMEKIVDKLRASSLNLALVASLYDRLNELPVVSFSGQRMKLPSLIFQLEGITATQNAFRAHNDVLGAVEIRTKEDLSRFNLLYLVHPWIDFLLNRQAVKSVLEGIPEESTVVQPSSLDKPSNPGPSSITTETRTDSFASRLGLSFDETQSLQTIARLGQSFGALLLTPNPGKVSAYRRAAAETPIRVKVEEIAQAALSKLVSSVRVLDVL
ncbi:hypothetical protein OG21DRAFT_1483764 [Imleria badia]|nr:hypothetical protein OG21DRAFT_1483764 [Imleria badia]